MMIKIMETELVGTKKTKKKKRPIYPNVNVASIPPIPEAEVADFKAKYISTIYLDHNDPELEKRGPIAELQYKRWNWANDNIAIYVNMLRVSGHNDTNIQALCDGDRPLCFPDQAVYAELQQSLKQLKNDLEQETGVANVKFVQTGSSVAGFSTNPAKGFPYLPSKITSVGKSDIDLVIVADHAVERIVEASKQKGLKIKEYSTICNLTDLSVRYGVKNGYPAKCLETWHQTWMKKLGAEIQLTFQRDPKDSFPPWEAEVVLPA
jgi:hypothetical protein